uniref:ribosomal protein L22 n=1 Tax=Phylloglossum drummondii TaxID=70003 RepID=UPI003000FCCB|nr:ribosomal protein L22 [Phylloglossum drummondii]
MNLKNNLDNKVIFSVKNVPMSASKLRRVLHQIRGHSYDEVLMLLEFMPYRTCHRVLTWISYAAQKAKYEMDWRYTDLFLNEFKVDTGSSRKRLRIRAQGRSYTIHKPTSHITIILKNLCIRGNSKKKNNTTLM